MLAGAVSCHLSWANGLMTDKMCVPESLVSLVFVRNQEFRPCHSGPTSMPVTNEVVMSANKHTADRVQRAFGSRQGAWTTG